MKKIDFHIHLMPCYPVEQSVADFKEMCEKNGYEIVCITMTRKNIGINQE